MVRQDTPLSYSPALLLRKNNYIIPFAPWISTFLPSYLCLYAAAAVCYVGVGEGNPDLYQGFNNIITLQLQDCCIRRH